MTIERQHNGKWVLTCEGEVVAQGKGTITVKTDNIDDDMELKRMPDGGGLKSRVESVRDSARERKSQL